MLPDYESLFIMSLPPFPDLLHDTSLTIVRVNKWQRAWVKPTAEQQRANGDPSDRPYKVRSKAEPGLEDRGSVADTTPFVIAGVKVDADG